MADESRESDVQRMRRFSRGEREALAELIARYERPVRRLLLGLLDNPSDVDDACQEVFLRLIQHLPGMSPRDSLRPWLFRTGLNLVRDRARRGSVRRWFRLAGSGEARTADESTREPSARMERQELVDRLHGAIRELRPAWREAVVLRDLMGLSPSDAADVLGVTGRVVNDRLYRARRELADRLRR
ncbi:MAG: RNA polymerase sigma factor [Phycisphaerae bacterium]|nr:RNA polymerase sigma factor [Phycisphaerae bacterium]